MAGLQYDQHAGQGWVEGFKVRGWQPVANLLDVRTKHLWCQAEIRSKTSFRVYFPRVSQYFWQVWRGCDKWFSRGKQTAKHAPQQFDEHHEAQEQVDFVDHIAVHLTDHTFQHIPAPANGPVGAVGNAKHPPSHSLLFK
jgi:hypothetical protein